MTSKDMDEQPCSGVDPVVDAPIIRMVIGKRSFFGLLDTCSQLTLAGRPLVTYLKFNRQSTRRTPTEDARILSRPGETLKKREEASVRMTWSQGEIYQTVIYVPELMCELILGRDFMKQTNIILNIPRNGWSFQDNPSKVFVFDAECKCCVHLPSWKYCNCLFTEYFPWKSLKKESSPIVRRNMDIVHEHEEEPELELAPSDDEFNVDVIDLTRDEDKAEVKVQVKHVPKKTKNGASGPKITKVDPELLKLAEDKAASLKLKRQSLLDEVNHIYEILDDDKVPDSNRAEFNQLVKALLLKYREFGRKFCI